jgi:hypothetical protein
VTEFALRQTTLPDIRALDPVLWAQVERCLAYLLAHDAAKLRHELDELTGDPGSLTEFAQGVFSLELARLGDVKAKAEFALHAGALLQAYRDPGLAKPMLAAFPELDTRWKQYLPLLAEFDAMRSKAAAAPAEPPAAVPADDLFAGDSVAKQVDSFESRPRTVPLQAAAFPSEFESPAEPSAFTPFAPTVPEPQPLPSTPDVETDEDGLIQACFAARQDAAALLGQMDALFALSERRREFVLCLFNLELTRLGVEDAKGAFAARAGLLLEAYREPGVATELVGQSAALRTLWDDLVPYLEEFFDTSAPDEAPGDPSGEFDLDESNAEAEAEAVADAIDVVEEAAAVEESVDLSDVEVVATEVAVTDADALEVMEEAPAVRKGPPPPPKGPPPPPAKTGPNRKSSAMIKRPKLPPPPPVASEVPSPETAEFWQFAESRLGLLPDADGALSGKQAFAIKTKQERAQLQTLARELILKFPASSSARALSCLMHLYVGCHLKAKTLFGQPNQQRRDALREGLRLLTPDVLAAGHAAVLFENDGEITKADFAHVVEFLAGFMAHCMARNLDPILPATIDAFVQLPDKH